MHVPIFRNRQVFVKVVPAASTVLSGMVTSETNEAWLQGMGDLVAEGMNVDVGICVGVDDGMAGVADA